MGARDGQPRTRAARPSDGPSARTAGRPESLAANCSQDQSASAAERSIIGRSRISAAAARYLSRRPPAGTSCLSLTSRAVSSKATETPFMKELVHSGRAQRRSVVATVPLASETQNARVCSRCGELAGEDRFCSTCGLNLAEQPELPTRLGWEGAQASDQQVTANVRENADLQGRRPLLKRPDYADPATFRRARVVTLVAAGLCALAPSSPYAGFPGLYDTMWGDRPLKAGAIVVSSVLVLLVGLASAFRQPNK